jgi:mRNA-degrading endonuclease RelE of RelBE toxin-antitoxin system
MSFDVIPSENFQKRAKKLSKKFKSLKADLSQLSEKLSLNPLMGTSIGGNAYKIRLAVKSKGSGKSGGFRLITYVYSPQKRVYLMDIYDKSEQSTISDKELGILIQSIENQL